MKEREVKLSASTEFELPDLGGLGDRVVAVPRGDERLSTVYFDSDDLRLARWGLSFRHRAGQGWTVKLPNDQSGGLLIRDEIVFKGGPRQPPATAVELAQGYLRRAELRPQVRLRAIGGPPAAPPEILVDHLARSASLAEVVTHAICDGVVRLMRHDPIVRLDTDPEGVHQALVATRRLRSDLRTFRAVLDQDWAAGLREKLGWLGEVLGDARDADVLLDRLTTRAQSLPDASTEGAAELISALEQRRVETHATLLEALRSDRYLDLIDKLIKAAQAPALTAPKADRAAAKALPPLVERAWRAHSSARSAHFRNRAATKNFTSSGSSPNAVGTPPRPARRRSASGPNSSPWQPATSKTSSASSTMPSSPRNGCATGPPAPTPRRRRSLPASSPPSNAQQRKKHARNGPERGNKPEHTLHAERTPQQASLQPANSGDGRSMSRQLPSNQGESEHPQPPTAQA
jgi:inorganic triphosphatase YgiF